MMFKYEILVSFVYAAARQVLYFFFAEKESDFLRLST